MARCELTGKGPVSKNLVSHSNIKTKSTANINVQSKKLHSQALNDFFSFNVAVKTLRTIENKSGLDSFILKADDKMLSKRALKLKNKIRKKLAGPAKSTDK